METIYREATRLSNLINDFLDLQRMESGKQLYHIAPVDAAAVVKEVAEQWMGKMSHHIEVDAPNPNVWVMADTDRLRQVLHNLMSNAVKYSPGAERIDIRVFTEGTSAVFEIQDYGLGIPEEAKELLFTKFYRVDNSDRRQIGGTGLGLAIVKEIVEAHRGAISFTSEMGRGTTFRVELLRYEPKRLGGRIVLLEDDDDLARQMQEAFDKLDVQCVQIRSAEEGILLLNRTGEHTPLLVVVDILLEGVKTGWDFLAHLYAQDKLRRVPVIVSSVLEPPNQFKEKEIGRYMSKPFTMDRLVQTAKRLMESDSEVSYVFPVQDTSLLTNSLKRSGIEAKEWRAEDDIIFIDIAPPSP
jgi:CheY-like chemotaxis protein